MTRTPLSLLERVCCQRDEPSWRRLVDLYTPFIRVTLTRFSLQDADIDDLTQEILSVLVRELPGFAHNGQIGAFRSWLRTVATHRGRDFLRRRRPEANAELWLDQLADPNSDLSRQWDREHDTFIARRLLALLENDFTRLTWLAFSRQMFDSQRPETVAAELGMTAVAVRAAKSRVLHRLRQEMAGLAC